MKEDSQEVAWIISAQYVSQTSANYFTQFKLRKRIVKVVKQIPCKGPLSKGQSQHFDNLQFSTLNTCTSLRSLPSLFSQNQTPKSRVDSPQAQGKPSIEANLKDVSSPDGSPEKARLGLEKTEDTFPEESVWCFTPKEMPFQSPTNNTSPETLKRSRLFSDLKGNISAQKEFKKNLQQLLRPQDHIVHGLIKEFLSTFDKAFRPHLDFKHASYTQEYQNLYYTIKRVVQRFTSVLERFLSWIYTDLIQNFTYGLSYEEVEPKHFIKEIIHELLFQVPESTSLLRAILSLIYMKHKNERIALRSTLTQRLNEDPYSYDDNHGDFYLAGLRSEQQPFTDVINLLKKLKTTRSPYTKFHLIQKVENEMKNSLVKMCAENSNSQEIKKLVNNFGYDVKIPIWMYCFVQAQEEELLVQKIFIEEFVDSKTITNSACFLAFEGCISHLLNSSNNIVEK